MQIDRILYPVTSLGPGKRAVIWTIGCNRRCVNCANPELWEFNTKKDLSLEEIYSIIKTINEKSLIDGITITGGEPFEQANELRELLGRIKPITEDILVFSGYTLDQLKGQYDRSIDYILDNIAVLVDGEYMDEKNDNRSVLRGSMNQQIHTLKSKFSGKYRNYILSGRKIQNVFYNNNLISVGIHNKI